MANVEHNVFVKFHQQGLKIFNKDYDKFKNNVLTSTREIQQKQLQMARTTSEGWKTRFKKQILGLKQTRLNYQKQLDSQKKNQGFIKEQAKGFALNKIRGQHEGFFKVLGMGQENWSKFNKEGGKFNSRGARVANKIRSMTHGFRGFKMEMLSVMFFGQGLQKFFSGFLQPALKAVGIFELWGATLELLFLPIAMALLQVLLPIFEWMMNWSDATKLMVGKLVLLGLAAGAFLAVLGMAVLGIGGIIIAFSSLWNIIDGMIPDVSVLGINVSSFVEAGLMIGLVKKLFDGLKWAAGGLLDKLMELPLIQQLFDKLGITMDDNKSIFQNFTTGVKDGLATIWGDFDSKFGGFKSSFMEGISTIFTDFEDKITGKDGMLGKFKTKLTEAEGWFHENFVNPLKDAWADMKNKFNLDTTLTSLDNLTDKLADLIPSLETIASLAERINTAFEDFDRGKKIISEDVAASGVNTPGSYVFSFFKKLMGFQTGGMIPKDGVYKLHAGEMVTPPNQTNNFSPTINANVGSNVDIEMLKRQLSSQWATQLAGLGRR